MDHLQCGRCSEGNDRHVGKGFLDHPQLRVVWPEVVPPRGNAVSLVDHEASQHPLTSTSEQQPKTMKQQSSDNQVTRDKQVTNTEQETIKSQPSKQLSNHQGDR